MVIPQTFSPTMCVLQNNHQYHAVREMSSIWYTFHVIVYFTCEPTHKYDTGTSIISIKSDTQIKTNLTPASPARAGKTIVRIWVFTAHITLLTTPASCCGVTQHRAGLLTSGTQRGPRCAVDQYIPTT